ncbi:hypothetical protein BDZ94DRAFT_1255449 [Collybia nuda]|uniref:Uncharacterized protein n=1 Tax=Collybia nuda TaxID=64659 RepID=A0A9P6CLL9_9AGAR|nr:hypothetical protein BDZ94DRAFT_1255449 [Collybia nuda]
MARSRSVQGCGIPPRRDFHFHFNFEFISALNSFFFHNNTLKGAAIKLIPFQFSRLFVSPRRQ